MTATAAPAAPPAAPHKEEELTLELVDDAQILAELQGMHFEDDKYIFPVRGGSAGWQLTYRAVKLACRMFEAQGEALEVLDLTSKYDEKDPEYIIVHAKVQRVKVTAKGQRIPLGSEVGVKRKWTKELRKDLSVHADPSFYEKACAQAQRNAKMALLPQDFLLEFKEMLIKKGAGKGQTPQGAPQRPAAPAQPAKPAQEAAKAPAAPAATQKPAQEAAKPAAPAQGAPAAPAAPADKAEKQKLTMQQQFWAVLKAAVPQAKTEKQQRGVLTRLTGKERVRDLEESVIKTLGPSLRLVPSGEAKISDIKGTLVITHAPTGEVRWPVGYKRPDDAPPPATPAAAAPAKPAAPAADPSEAPPETEEKLF